MKLGIRVSVILGVAAGLCAQEVYAQEVPLVRDGADWVHVATGTLLMTPQSRLQVISRGHIVVRGGQSANAATYRLTQRVKARTEEEARRLFGNILTSKVVNGNVTRLEITPVSPVIVRNDLEVTVPRQLMGVAMESRMGDLEAYDFDGSIDALTAAGEIRADRIKGGFAGRTGGGEIHLGSISGPIRCVSGGGSIFIESAGIETNCGTAGGEVAVKQSVGPLVLSTQGGNISVDRAGSSVEARSAAGGIEVLQAGGVVTAHTQGGLIQVGSAQGVKAESAAGMVRVKSANGPMSISAAAGSILAELLSGGRIENSSLVAAGGDITVLIPSNLGVSIAARNETGGNPRIVSDFSEIHTRSVGLLRPPLVAQGSINGGGPVLNLDTAGGVIYLRRVK